MAKTRAAIAAAAAAVEADGFTPSTKLSKLMDGIKKPFISFAKDFEAMNVRREELAPKFMSAFGLWTTERNDAGMTANTFVNFVRYIDPNVPQGRDEYRKHRVYQAADYLRRLNAGGGGRKAAGAEGEAGGEGAAVAAKPATAGNALVRILKALINIVPEGQRLNVWTAVKGELNWSDDQVKRVQKQMNTTSPLVEFRGVNLERLRVTIPAHGEQRAKAVNE